MNTRHLGNGNEHDKEPSLYNPLEWLGYKMKILANIKQRSTYTLFQKIGTFSDILKSSGEASCKGKQAFTIQPTISFLGIQHQIKNIYIQRLHSNITASLV